MNRLLWAAFLLLPAAAAGQSDLNAILKPAVSLLSDSPKPKIEIRFSNAGTKEITGFSFSRVDMYQDGSQAAAPIAEGADFVTLAAGRLAVGGRDFRIQTLRAGENFSNPYFPRAAKNGSAWVRSEVKVLAILFADYTAVGDPQQIQQYLKGRAQHGAWIAEAIAEAKQSLATQNSAAALEAGIAKGKRGEGSFNPYRVLLLQSVSSALSQSGAAAADRVLAGWQACRAADEEYSRLR